MRLCGISLKFLFKECEKNLPVCHGLCRPGPGDWSWWEEGCRGPKSRVKQGCFVCRKACLYIFIQCIFRQLKKKKKQLSKNKAKQIFEGPENIAGPHNWADHISVRSLEGVTEGTKHVTLSQDLTPGNCVQLCSFLQQLMRNKKSLRNGTQKKIITYWIP